jgi:hypothetical protein
MHAYTPAVPYTQKRQLSTKEKESLLSATL